MSAQGTSGMPKCSFRNGTIIMQSPSFSFEFSNVAFLLVGDAAFHDIDATKDVVKEQSPVVTDRVTTVLELCTKHIKLIPKDTPLNANTFWQGVFDDLIKRWEQPIPPSDLIRLVELILISRANHMARHRKEGIPGNRVVKAADDLLVACIPEDKRELIFEQPYYRDGEGLTGDDVPILGQVPVYLAWKTLQPYHDKYEEKRYHVLREKGEEFVLRPNPDEPPKLCVPSALLTEILTGEKVLFMEDKKWWGDEED
ncbi:hypothetical protein ACJ41O_011034 [Fusarium nematophilum]